MAKIKAPNEGERGPLKGTPQLYSPSVAAPPTRGNTR
jgi:hypothetical protein